MRPSILDFSPAPSVLRRSPKPGALTAQAHKDTDARWTKKGGQNHYGYKNPINIDKDTKLIASHACTDASVHDSQVLEAVLRDEAVGGVGLF